MRFEKGTDEGAPVVHPSNNTISGNRVEGNNYGIYLSNASNNRIFNNYLENKKQVIVNGSAYNSWDNGYPKGGNYWSDYKDVDRYRGPKQNQPGSDGIWDHPYKIDENNVDRYPLSAWGMRIQPNRTSPTSTPRASRTSTTSSSKTSTSSSSPSTNKLTSTKTLSTSSTPTSSPTTTVTQTPSPTPYPKIILSLIAVAIVAIVFAFLIRRRR